MSQKPPKWVAKHVVRCLNHWQLDKWRVETTLVDLIDHDPNCPAKIDMSPRYFKAILWLRDDIQRDEEGYQTITHEMAHLVQANT